MAHKEREGAVGRAQVALVRRGVVVPGMTVILSARGVVMRAGVVVQHRMVHRAKTGSLAVQHLFRCGTRAGHRAKRGRSNRTPDGEQNSKQQQEPDTPGLHVREVSKGFSSMVRGTAG